MVSTLIDRFKLFWETNPEKRGLLTTLFILATLPLLVLAALTIQNLRQRAEAPVQILHTSGNPVTRTSDPDVLIKITLPDDWVLPQASPSGKNILVGNVHAQPACPNAGDPGTTTTCGTTTYNTCVDNLGRFGTNSSFCSSGATAFRCYYSQNSSCISGANETDFNYSCSACPQSNQSFPTPTPITPSTSSCQTSCGACPTTTTFTYTTYDTCEDNLRQSGTNLCKNGSTAFRCYARENSNCASANPGVYNYSCPADIDVKACPKAGEAGTTTTYGTTTYDTCIDNKGGVNTNGTLCTGGATKFRCYYSQNDTCISGASSSDFNYTCSMPSPTATPSPTPFQGGGGGGGGGGGAAPQPTATVTLIPPTPTPTPHILREINIENKDTDGSSGGSEPLRITANFADYLIKPISWKLNRLKEGQDEASRIVQVTFFDGTTFVPYTATVILARPTEKTGILSTVEVSFIDCQNLESIAIGTECHASALAYDAAMVPIFEGVAYEWGISSNNSIGTLNPTLGVTTTFSTKNVGTGDIWVIAKQGEGFTKKSSHVIIVPQTTTTPTGETPTAPSPTPITPIGGGPLTSTPTPTPISSAGFGKAIHIPSDTSNSYVIAPSFSGPLNFGGLAIGVWVKPDAKALVGTNPYVILGKEMDNQVSGYMLSITNKKFEFRIAQRKTDAESLSYVLARSTTTVEANKWYYIAAVAVSETLYLNVNGVAESVQSIGAVFDPSSNKLIIGCAKSNSLAGCLSQFYGQIDEVVVSQVGLNPNPPSSPIKPSDRTVALYHLDGDVRDSGGHGLDGQTFGSIQFIDSTIAISLQGDINNDGVVDTKDRDILVGDFGQKGANLSADINHDRVVNIFDYNILVENFGKRR